MNSEISPALAEAMRAELRTQKCRRSGAVFTTEAMRDALGIEWRHVLWPEVDGKRVPVACHDCGGDGTLASYIERRLSKEN